MRRIFVLTTHRCSKLLSDFTIRKRGVRGAHCVHGCYGRRAVSACVVHIPSLLRKLMVYSLPEDEKPDIHISPTLQRLQQRKSMEDQEILNYERSRKQRHVSVSRSSPPGRAAIAAGGQPTNWDFTKRKRWTDLLITELSDTIILILAPTCKILYCDQAIQELLGWNDADLVDYDFLGLISGEYFILIVPTTFVILDLASPPPLLAVEDQYAFRMNFQTAIMQRKNLLTHIRLKHRSSSPTIPPKETLYEFNGYPHFSTEDGQPTSSCQCFIAMARPYHTHNTAPWVLSPSPL
jgi:hypothetical protein